ncbi:hypothetical protein [Methylopila sp. 73B]|uniref:hypothetical protein n=1 Tax=Methylopila sp. 73B TaxID=1120792 RepID=UPI00035EC619|nr:hypothetical protein [Methylopila sp. 73B]
MSEDLEFSMHRLQTAIERQIEQQEETNNVIRALTEMLGHSVTATNDLVEAIKTPASAK